MKYYKWFANKRPVYGAGEYVLDGGWQPRIEGKLIPCKHGYHVCREQDVAFCRGTNLAAVDIDSVDMLKEQNEIVVRTWRLVRWLPWARKDMTDCAADDAATAADYAAAATAAVDNAAYAAAGAHYAASFALHADDARHAASFAANAAAYAAYTAAAADANAYAGAYAAARKTERRRQEDWIWERVHQKEVQA